MTNEQATTSPATSWVPAALVAAALYLALGLGFAALAGAAPSARLRFAWRLGAYVASAVVFVAQIAWEQVRLRPSVRATAWHACLAVALGAFGLALAAVLHPHDPALGHWLGLSLVLWPLLTAVPALLAALVVAAALARLRLA